MSELRREELIISDIPALLKEEMIVDDKSLSLELILDSEKRKNEVSDNWSFGSNEEFNLLSIFKDDNANIKNNEQLDGQKDWEKNPKKDQEKKADEKQKDKKEGEKEVEKNAKKNAEKNQKKESENEVQEKGNKKREKEEADKAKTKEDVKKEVKKKDQKEGQKKETKIKDQEKDPKKDQKKDSKKETKIKDQEKDPKKDQKKDSKKDQKKDLKNKSDQAKTKDEKDTKKDSGKEVQKKDSSSQNKAKYKETMKEDNITDSESDHKEEKNAKIKKDSSSSSKSINIKIPYRETSHIPSCLFEQDNTNNSDLNRIKNYNEYIHETSRLFSVDTACRYVFIKRISRLDNAIQNVINEGWNAFACTKDDKDFEDLMTTNISEKLLEDYDLTANTEKIQGYEPLNLPKTRITFHANPIMLNNEQIVSEKKNYINKDIIFD
ncbi:Uncharacterized protein CTYZ_00003652 [Cryptosporidium tyzzeri]|nr:Uncharacterized protein CTYZ_00003652 [Cryptosporidium tyzzeri]